MIEHKTILDFANKILKPLGFKKRKSTFYIKNEGNFGLIDFQKSRDSTDNEIKFTINLGIYSVSIGEALQDDGNIIPEIDDCHWKQRIGFLFSNRNDHWWIFRVNLSPESLFSELLEILKVAVTEIQRRMSDNFLKKEWLMGNATGLTEIQKYIFLTTLLKLDKDERLFNVIREFISYSKDNSHEYIAKQHLKFLDLTDLFN